MINGLKGEQFSFELSEVKTSKEMDFRPSYQEIGNIYLTENTI